jgi:hypothetical protein
VRLVLTWVRVFLYETGRSIFQVESNYHTFAMLIRAMEDIVGVIIEKRYCAIALPCNLIDASCQ